MIFARSGESLLVNPRLREKGGGLIMESNMTKTEYDPKDRR